MMNLDERIKQACVFNTKHLSTYEEGMTNLTLSLPELTADVKQLIRDVLTEITPKLPEYKYADPNSKTEGEYWVALAFRDYGNRVIAELEAKAKELGL